VGTGPWRRRKYQGGEKKGHPTVASARLGVYSSVRTRELPAGKRPRSLGREHIRVMDSSCVFSGEGGSGKGARINGLGEPSRKTKEKD